MKTIIGIALLFISLAFLSCEKFDITLNNNGIESKNNMEGKSGSMARIIVKGDYAYAVNNTSLKVIDIADPENPNYIRSVEIGFGIETIYPFKNYLFIGSSSGMFIYGLTNPENPEYLSEFEHITACDPVIANDSIAFVTLRNNIVCNRWNELKQIDIINVKDVQNPFLINSYTPDFDPYGLDRDDTHLFVCNGDKGLTIYHINKMIDGEKSMVNRISDIDAFDAIIWQGKLFIIGELGFYQYDFSDIMDIRLISSILKNQ